MNPKDFFAHASLHHVPPRRRCLQFVTINDFRERKLCAVPLSFPWMTFGCLLINGRRHALVYMHDISWEYCAAANFDIIRIFPFNPRIPECGVSHVGSVCLGHNFDYSQIYNSHDAEHYFWSTASKFRLIPGHNMWETEEHVRNYIRRTLEIRLYPLGIAELNPHLVYTIMKERS